jgi:hypothetical protein
VATISGAVVTIGGHTYTETAGSLLVIGSATLSRGGQAATISGTVVSVGSSGVVIGSSTATYSAIATSSGYSGPLATGGANAVGDGRMLTVMSWLCGLTIGVVLLI